MGYPQTPPDLMDYDIHRCPKFPLVGLIHRGVRLPLYFYQKYIIDINDIIFPIKIIKKRGMQPF